MLSMSTSSRSRIVAVRPPNCQGFDVDSPGVNLDQALEQVEAALFNAAETLTLAVEEGVAPLRRRVHAGASRTSPSPPTKGATRSVGKDGHGKTAEIPGEVVHEDAPPLIEAAWGEKPPSEKTGWGRGRPLRPFEERYKDWEDRPAPEVSTPNPWLELRQILRAPHTRGASTLSIGRATKEELEMGRLLYPPVDIPTRPKARTECVDADRPCPFVSCKYHLYLDVDQRTGAVKLNFPQLEVWEMPETCALDVAELGGLTLEETGFRMNLTRERTRQLEGMAMVVVKRELPSDAEVA